MKELEILKKYNLRTTPKRKIILSTLLSSQSPLTPEEIYDHFDKETISINLSTVYRALTAFEHKGIVRKDIRSNGKAYYQLNNEKHKHQIICKICGKTMDIEGCPLHEYSDKISKETGFEITGHSLELIGICPECRNQ